MSSALLHRKIKDALTRQRSVVTASPQAARKFLSDLGIEDLASNIGKKIKQEVAVRKLAPKRTAKKAAAKKKAS
jgi:hypothetical protein